MDTQVMSEARRRDEDLKMMKLPSSSSYIWMVYQQYKDQPIPITFLDYFQKVSGWQLATEEKKYVQKYPLFVSLM